MNVAYNGVGDILPDSNQPEAVAGESQPTATMELDPEEKALNGGADTAVNGSGEKHLEHGRRSGCKGKVKVNEGDAWSVPNSSLLSRALL